jgi:glycosyltransferase involved in cell wall biosynthesis
MKELSSKGLIGIDGRSQTGGVKWGGATYVYNLLLNIPFLDAVYDSRPSNNFLWNNRRIPREAGRRKWLAYHAPNYTAPLWLDLPVILSVHDIAYLVRKDWYPYRSGPIRRAYYRACIKKADRIIVPSEFTRQEIIKKFPAAGNRIRTIPLAVSGSFYPDLETAARTSLDYRLPERFLLHVGDIHPRRRLDLMSEAAKRTGLPLVVVGRELVKVPDSYYHVRLEGVSGEDLRGLYCAAEALLYFSEYEGFGLPVLEAMACGTPVIAGSRASVPEVCGDAAILVSGDPVEFAEAVSTAVSNRRQYARLGLERAAEFSWKKTAAKTVDVYMELIS